MMQALDFMDDLVSLEKASHISITTLVQEAKNMGSTLVACRVSDVIVAGLVMS